MELGPPDPSGCYVLVFRRDVIGRVRGLEGVEVIEYGDRVIVRVKSRSMAKKLLRTYREYIVKP